MKKFLIGTILLTSACSVQAADWTLIIESWAETYCNPSSETERIIMNSATAPGIDNYSIDKLSQNAKRGYYPKVPKPYRYDLLPAIITETTPGFEPGSSQKITIPLKNATYGDIPLKSLDFVTDVGDDNLGNHWYKAYNFGKLDVHQVVKLLQLSKNVHQTMGNGDKNKNDFLPGGSFGNFTLNQDGEVVMYCFDFLRE